jgi:hypothetical protein
MTDTNKFVCNKGEPLLDQVLRSLDLVRNLSVRKTRL